MTAIKHLILTSLTQQHCALAHQCCQQTQRLYIDINDIIESIYIQQNSIRQSNSLTPYIIYKSLGPQSYEAYEHIALEKSFSLFSSKRGILSVNISTIMNKNNLYLMDMYGKIIYLKKDFASCLKQWLDSEPAFYNLPNAVQQLKDYYKMQHHLLSTRADIVIACEKLNDQQCINTLVECLSKSFWRKYFYKRPGSKPIKIFI